MPTLVARIMVSLAAVPLLLPGAAHAHSTGLMGYLFDAEMWSPTLQQDMTFRIYLPPDYFYDEDRRYPTLYMLHGAGGNYTEWSDSFLPEQLDDMIGLQIVQPMIVVMPDGGTRTYWANWDKGPRWSDYVAYDVVSEIDSRFRTVPLPSRRAIGGLSMGGLGAMQIAMNHPDIFGVVGAHSPSIRLEPDPEMWFLSAGSFQQQNPLWLAANAAGVDRMVYWLDVGVDDWWRSNIEDLRDVLFGARLNLTWRLFAGTHEAEYWIEHVPDYLRFYSDNLRE
ncbi:MAG TPA: alpha/beta hydrolase-fold protein [Chloroflexota bacterium]|nr:alpha/beta hydrolase-fold protein [Chloroflexota bacterium]